MQPNQSTRLATILPLMHTLRPLLLAIAGCSIALISATADTLDKTDCNGVVLDDSHSRSRSSAIIATRGTASP